MFWDKKFDDEIFLDNLKHTRHEDLELPVLNLIYNCHFPREYVISKHRFVMPLPAEKDNIREFMKNFFNELDKRIRHDIENINIENVASAHISITFDDKYNHDNAKIAYVGRNNIPLHVFYSYCRERYLIECRYKITSLNEFKKHNVIDIDKITSLNFPNPGADKVKFKNMINEILEIAVNYYKYGIKPTPEQQEKIKFDSFGKPNEYYIDGNKDWKFFYPYSRLEDITDRLTLVEGELNENLYLLRIKFVRRLFCL